MVVVESMLQSAVDVVKTSFTRPCTCADGDNRNKQDQLEETEEGGSGEAEKTNTAETAGASIFNLHRPNILPLSAISSSTSTCSVDNCDVSAAVGKQEAVAAAERRLAEAERRLAAAIDCEKQYQQQENRDEEARDQPVDDPSRQEMRDTSTSNSRHNGHEDGCIQTDAYAGYGLVPEQIVFETEETASNSRKTSCVCVSDRPPIAKPPISKNKGAALGGTRPTSTRSCGYNSGDRHESALSIGSGESFVRGEMLLSTSGDDNSGSVMTVNSNAAFSETYYTSISVFASYSSASEAATDDMNKVRDELSSPPKIPTREGLKVTTASLPSPLDAPLETRSPAIPFSPGAHSACTNPSYISSSSEDDDGDDLFELESLQGDLYKIAQMQRQRHQYQQVSNEEEPMQHQSSPVVSSEMNADAVIIIPPQISNAIPAEHEGYYIQEGSSREWLQLDSLSGDGGRPMPKFHTAHAAPATIICANEPDSSHADHSDSLSAGGKRGEDLEERLASSSQRFFLDQTSSLSLDVFESATSPRSESTRGGLASLDAILMASSSLSICSDDDILSDDEEETARVQVFPSTQSEIPESLQSTLEKFRTHEDADNFNYGSKSKERKEDAHIINSETKKDVPKMDQEVLLLSSDSVAPINELLITKNVEGKEWENECLGAGIPPFTLDERKPVVVVKEPAIVIQDRRNALSDLSSERAPVGFLDTLVFSSESSYARSIEGQLKEKTQLVIKELEGEYQERVEGMKRQYSAKLKRLRRQLDIQLEHDLQEQMDRAGLADTSESNYTKAGDETKSAESALCNPSYTGERKTSKSKKQRKDAMEERLQSLLLRFNSPGTSAPTSYMKVETPPNFETACQPQQTNNSPCNPTVLTNDETLITLMSIKKVYESQQNWLEVDLEHDADEKTELLLVGRETYHQRQAKAFEEMKALERLHQNEQTEYRELSAKAEDMYKVRISDAKAKLQQVRDDNEEFCAGLKYEIGREENTIEELSSSLDETQKHNASLRKEANEQTNRIKFLRSESLEVQERLKKLAMTLDQEEDKRDTQLEKERVKTDKAIESAEAVISAAIKKQFKEGDKKKEALSNTQRKVEERLAALQKLLAITESSKASSSHDSNIREMELIEECRQLTQTTTLTEERKSNKGVAFARVVGQLNESYQALTQTIEASRNDVEAYQRQAEVIKNEILHLRRDNEQVSSWISELDAVLKSMGFIP